MAPRWHGAVDGQDGSQEWLGIVGGWLRHSCWQRGVSKALSTEGTQGSEYRGNQCVSTEGTLKGLSILPQTQILLRALPAATQAGPPSSGFYIGMQSWLLKQ